jgi:hypothetical protein
LVPGRPKNPGIRKNSLLNSLEWTPKVRHGK